MDPHRIVVVSGIPRSGTSLMMQMLSAAGLPVFTDDRRAADASNPRGYYEHAAVKASRSDTGWVDAAEGHAVKVIHALLPELPRDRAYDVLLMRRRLEDIVASQNRMLETLGGSIPDLPSGRLVQIYSSQFERTQRLLDTEACFRWQTCDFEALLRDPLVAAAGVVEFLGLDASEETLAEVVEPALCRKHA